MESGNTAVFERITDTIVQKKGITKMFLDYDGTLVDLTSQPEFAVPGEELLSLLRRLKVVVPLYIVTGRDLEGIISLVGAGFNIIAMHGSQFISEEGNRWNIENFDYYRSRTKVLRERYLHLEKQYPGLRIIDKGGGLQFHYYNVRKSVLSELEQTISKVSEEGFEMYSGKYVFELRVRGVNKGSAIRRFMSTKDFILFSGDDRTDEEAFNMLQGHITIKVGEGETSAMFRVDSPANMKRLLSDMLEEPEIVFRKGK